MEDGPTPEPAESSSHAALNCAPDTAAVKVVPAGVVCTCIVWAAGSADAPI